MKKKRFWMCLIAMLVMVLGCSAPMPDENVGEVQEALCTGAPVVTGSVGTTSTSPYITTALPWAGPPAEAYSFNVFTSAMTSGKVSVGATSGANYHVTGCIGDDGPCVIPPAAPITKLRLFNGTKADGTLYISFYMNDAKGAEMTGVNAATTLQNSKLYSGGITLVRQGTGANSRVYFEGYNAGVFVSANARLFNSCGSIP